MNEVYLQLKASNDNYEKLKSNSIYSNNNNSKSLNMIYLKKKGDLVNSKSIKKTKSNLLVFEIKENDITHLDTILNKFIKDFISSNDNIGNIDNSYDLQLIITVYANDNSIPSISFSKDQLAYLVNNNISLDIDLMMVGN